MSAMETIVNEIENNIGSDDFEYIMEENISKLEEQGAGIEAVEPLLKLMERHPLEDFGMPGAIVHFVERFYKNGYEQLLVDSIKRRPTLHTVWMLNRILNANENREYYASIMEDIANSDNLEEEIINQAKAFLGK